MGRHETGNRLTNKRSYDPIPGTEVSPHGPDYRQFGHSSRVPAIFGMRFDEKVIVERSEGIWPFGSRQLESDRSDRAR